MRIGTHTLISLYRFETSWCLSLSDQFGVGCKKAIIVSLETEKAHSKHNKEWHDSVEKLEFVGTTSQ